MTDAAAIQCALAPHHPGGVPLEVLNRALGWARNVEVRGSEVGSANLELVLGGMVTMRWLEHQGTWRFFLAAHLAELSFDEFEARVCGRASA